MSKNIFKRSKKNPILGPVKSLDWESKKVYNPGAIYHNNKFHLIYRAMGNKWLSSLGYAVSKDGECFTRLKKPIMSPENNLEKNGLEDPRLTKINNVIYMAYAAYDGITPRLHTATSNNLRHWKKHGPALSEWKFEKNGGVYTKWHKGKPKTKKQSHEWSKSGAIFPQKINGKFLMLFGEYRIWLATSKNGKNWHGSKRPFLAPRKGNYFDNAYVEMGPPPVKTDQGWLVLYHGVDKSIIYRLGYLLLNLDDPSKIIYRSKKPIFEPQEDYELSGMVDILPGGFKGMSKMSQQELDTFLKQAEKNGFMPAVTFCCGTILKNNTMRIYYGAGDSVICTATANIKDILSSP